MPIIPPIRPEIILRNEMRINNTGMMAIIPRPALTGGVIIRQRYTFRIPMPKPKNISNIKKMIFFVLNPIKNDIRKETATPTYSIFLLYQNKKASHRTVCEASVLGAWLYTSPMK